MQLLATPTLPADLKGGEMIDVASIPDEYAVVTDVSIHDDCASIFVKQGGQLHGLIVDRETPVPIISYVAESNTLETGK